MCKLFGKKLGSTANTIGKDGWSLRMGIDNLHIVEHENWLPFKWKNLISKHICVDLRLSNFKLHYFIVANTCYVTTCSYYYYYIIIMILWIFVIILDLQDLKFNKIIHASFVPPVLCMEVLHQQDAWRHWQISCLCQQSLLCFTGMAGTWTTCAIIMCNPIVWFTIYIYIYI